MYKHLVGRPELLSSDFTCPFTKAMWLQRPDVDGPQLRSHRSSEFLKLNPPLNDKNTLPFSIFWKPVV